MSNSELFEEWLLEETAEGSNVYEGTFEAPSDYWYMKFYTALADIPDISNDWKASRQNVICYKSADPTNARGIVSEIGNSGILSADILQSDYLNYDPISFEILGCYGMEITLRVDLNTGKLYAWNANGTMLAVFKGQDTPDFSTLDQYIGYNAGIVYLPECDFGFRYYDFVSKKYYGARGGANTPITIFNKRQSLRPQIDSEGLFTVDNWTGGTLNFECYQFPNALLTVNPDEMRIPEATPYLADQIHLIGDFCGWMFLDEYTVLPDASDPYIFHCTLPAGTSEFKITEDTEWAVQFGKIPGTAQKNADGSITMHILNDSDTDNFQFTSPITEAISFTVDLRTMTVTFPAGSPIAVDEAKDYTGVMVARLDDGFFEPWAGASEAVMQNYDAIAWPQPDGSYQFNFFVPREQFRVRFISELAPKGSPNKLIVPGSDDRELASDTEGNAYSRAIVTTDQNAGYWTIKNWKGGDISVTVTPGENPTVKFSTQSEADGGWYLVGTPTDWIAPSEANAEFYSN